MGLSSFKKEIKGYRQKNLESAKRITIIISLSVVWDSCSLLKEAKDHSEGSLSDP